ncbi:MAG: NADH-quinone oxidoreductase subunit M [Chromatiaceae bacterium]|nr:NADH-quinone oxidoreductase subunit M [Gammaproteobacteria bacterium]MCP5448525.1 NADH-quinone oxidoreductase subunit M [Chromatiaceae bacterium]MCB1860167.1 NADH-quinone oxidoreductase subunit M [Gammaproteobacteria bacterium]MCB1871616.1 NADH-quinone oxidoreductase subunit M [Gammaproteobacteria bacterium]MCB1880233.1 NADH-quinone oxidoreductase subunit M [Gammaproteobacteria bacterium]
MTFTELPWAVQINYPILATLQLLPLLAMAVALAWNGRRHLLWVGLSAAALELLLALDLYLTYDPGTGAMQFAERLSLLGPLEYHAAADGITVLFVLLNALLTLMVVIYSEARRLQPLSLVLAVVFLVEATLMSLLVSLNLFWFLFMSAAQFFPVGYLIWRWASAPEKDLALTRFLQFMGVGLVLLLAGTLMLGLNHADATGRWSFDLFDLAAVEVPAGMLSVVFFLLFYGLGLRTPIFPFHGWLPIIAEHGSIAVAPVFLLGLKTGVYGMLRFVFPLLPEAVLQWHRYIVAFALAGVFYAAVMALLQVNLRRLLAFAVVSHTSLMVIGLFTLGEYSFAGSIVQSVNFGLAITGLVFMIGLIHRRTQSVLLSRLGGLFDLLPLLGITFLVAGLSIIGMPGTPGFDAVHLVMEDSIRRFGALVTIAAALGNVIAAGFLLLAFQRAFLSPASPAEDMPEIERASTLEKLVSALVILLLLGGGFYLEPWLALVDGPAQRLSLLFNPGSG